jgi:hypothetical protein
VTYDSPLNSILDSPKDLPSQVITPFRSEYNFLKYPFFDLYKKSKRDFLEIHEQVYRDGDWAEIIWTVSRNIKGDFPSSLGRKIHKYLVEKILTELPKPICNPIRLGSLREICRALGISEGGNKEDIKKALKDIVMAGIESKGTFFLKSKKIFLDRTFHLYDDVIFAGQELPIGQKADAVYVMLGSWVLENVNSDYTVPLDWDYHKGLKGDITSRMYELLSLDFFVALEHKKAYVEKEYLKWCPYFPIIPQDKLYRVNGILKSAFQQHVSSQFFAQLPEFTPIPQQANNWIIKFYIGHKAIQDYKWAKSQGRKATFPEKFPMPLDAQNKIKTIVAPVAPVDSQKQEYIDFLQTHGVNNAEKLVTSSPHTAAMMDIIIQDFKTKRKEQFKFEKSPKDWLAWAFSSASYQRPSGIKTQEEVIAAKRKKENDDNARRKHDDEDKKKQEYQETYLNPIIKKFKQENPNGWDILYQMQADEFLSKGTDKFKEEYDEEPDRVKFKEPITGLCIKALKETLRLLSFEDWLKNKKIP